MRPPPFRLLRSALALALVAAVPAATTPTAAAAQRPVELRRVLLGTAGTADGFSALTLGEVGGLGFDDEGDLHILDTQAAHVVVVDTTGALLRVVGRRGEGPGEFRMPSELHVYGDGRLALVDFGRGLVVLDSDGGDRGALRLSDAGYNRSRLVTAGGELVSWDTVEGVLLEGGAGTRRIVRGEVERPERWRVVHEAPMPQLAGPDGRVADDLWAGGLPGLVEYVPELRVAALPDGRLAVADTTTYRIALLAPDGSVAGRIERSQRPRPVTEALRDRARQAALDDLDDAAGGATMSLDDGRTVPARDYARRIQRQRAELMRFGTEVPVIRELAADASGRIWVLRDAGDGAATALDLFTGDGRLLGTVVDPPGRLPDAFGPRGLAAWLRLDDFGVARIRIERVEVVE